MENWKPYVVKVSVSVSVSIEGLVSVSVSVSIGGFFEYRYQSRYRLGALLSPGISPGIDSEAAKVSVSVSVPKSWYRLSLLWLRLGLLMTTWWADLGPDLPRRRQPHREVLEHLGPQEFEFSRLFYYFIILFYFLRSKYIRAVNFCFLCLFSMMKLRFKHFLWYKYFRVINLHFFPPF